MTIIEAVRSISEDQAREWAKTYYGKNGNAAYSGAYFELVGREESELNRISAGDLYAPMCLSVKVPIKVGVYILESDADEVNGLLAAIPSDLGLRALSESEYESVLGEGSSAWKLWDILRATHRKEGRWYIGPTTASKIMARKRPHLIPIEDKVVNSVIGSDGKDSWDLWWEALSEHGDEMEKLARVVREAADRPDLSTLRALDVALWMKGKRT